MAAARDREAAEGVLGAPGNGDHGPAAPRSAEPATGRGGDELPEPEEQADEAVKPRRWWRTWWVEWGLVVGGALAVALIIRAFLFQAFWIPTGSMEPTLHRGDRVLVNKLSYKLHDVNRGDIVVFERPQQTGSNGSEENEVKDLIKRVVGLPGETIEARDCVVYIDGARLQEPYLPDGTCTTELPATPIPGGHVFVMGDNRGNSQDSRRFRAIDVDSIVGRAFVRIYPLDDIGGL